MTNNLVQAVFQYFQLLNTISMEFYLYFKSQYISLYRYIMKALVNSALNSHLKFCPSTFLILPLLIFYKNPMQS